MEKKGMVKDVCPLSRGSCKLCVLYVGRHYYALSSCRDYLRRLQEAAAPKKKEG